MNKYVEPDIHLPAFTCPYCEAFSNIRLKNIISNYDECLSLSEDNKLVVKIIEKHSSPNSKITVCDSCNNAILWIDDTIIYPKNINSYIPNQDLSDEIKVIYNEASAIYHNSPRASCALLRLCLEKICILLECKPDKNLDTNIKTLAEQHNFDNQIIAVMEYVRITGNNAVHPNIILETDTKKIADNLFKLINIIANELITKPKQYKEMFNLDIPISKKEATNKKHNKEVFPT